VIGLENAKRLKELGVEFEAPAYLRYLHAYTLTNVFIPKSLREDRYWWIPTLSQLLEEIEERGWFWDVWHDCTGCGIDVWTHEIEKAKWNTTADTCEDAVALALIEILEGEK
jgi:hypothetical protein